MPQLSGPSAPCQHQLMCVTLLALGVTCPRAASSLPPACWSLLLVGPTPPPAPPAAPPRRVPPLPPATLSPAGCCSGCRRCGCCSPLPRPGKHTQETYDVGSLDGGIAARLKSHTAGLLLAVSERLFRLSKLSVSACCCCVGSRAGPHHHTRLHICALTFLRCGGGAVGTWCAGQGDSIVKQGAEQTTSCTTCMRPAKQADDSSRVRTGYGTQHAKHSTLQRAAALPAATTRHSEHWVLHTDLQELHS